MSLLNHTSKEKRGTIPTRWVSNELVIEGEVLWTLKGKYKNSEMVQ